MCQATFLGLHGIKSGRLKRKVLKFHKEYGGHYKISDQVRDRMRQHIRLFPARESHYSRTKNTHHKYLDASLTVAAMHKDFVNENTDLEGEVKYWPHSHTFNTEINVSFGYPRSDICSTCERQHAEIKAAEVCIDTGNVKRLKTENELHLRKADVIIV